MKFTINTEKLRDALQYVTNVIEKRFTYPILTNVLFDVDENNTLRLRATDHDISLMAEIEVENLEAAGSVTIPGKKCLDVVRTAANSSEVMIDATGDSAILTIGRSTFKLATMPAAEFPAAPTVESQADFSVQIKVFIHLLQSAASSMGVGDVRPHLNGTLIELTSVHFRSVASDGMSMCICTDTDNTWGGDENVTALVPRKAVLELIRSYSASDGDLNVSIAENVFRVEGLGRTLITNLIGSPFPAYMRVVPDASDSILRCDRTAMIRGLDQAAPTVESQADFSVQIKVFIHLLQSAASSMGVGDVRPHLNGTLIELTSVHFRSVASDGMSMCICTDTDNTWGGDENVTALVPRKAVLELIRSYSASDGDLNVSIAENVFRVEGLGRTLITNLIGSPFPAYMRVVPDASDSILRCDRTAMIRGLDQAATLSDQSQRVYFEVEKDHVKILATTEAGDRADVQVPAEFTADSTKVAFKHDRLRRILDAFDCDEVILHLPEPRDVVRIESDQQKDLLFVVSPIRS